LAHTGGACQSATAIGTQSSRNHAGMRPFLILCVTTPFK
jgi:hypothetical protein